MDEAFEPGKQNSEDVRPIWGATIRDLDLLRFEREYLPSLVARNKLAAHGGSLEQKLAATKMVASEGDITPTLLGMLVVGKGARELDSWSVHAVPTFG